MRELQLEAKTPEEERVKVYLNENASETLREKIENGTVYEKDGYTLTNRKTLSDFMEYACAEARKQAEKGAHSACIEDRVVFGWAIHYFEEDSIVGTLYHTDGTPYKPQVSKYTPKQSNTVATQGKPSEKSPVPTVDKNQVPGQSSFFDFLPPEEQPKAKEDEQETEVLEPKDEINTGAPEAETVEEEPNETEQDSSVSDAQQTQPVNSAEPITSGTAVTEESQATDVPTTDDLRMNPYLYVDENGELHEVNQAEDDAILEHICLTFGDGILLRW